MENNVLNVISYGGDIPLHEMSKEDYEDLSIKSLYCKYFNRNRAIIDLYKAYVLSDYSIEGRRLIYTKNKKVLNDISNIMALDGGDTLVYIDEKGQVSLDFVN